MRVAISLVIFFIFLVFAIQNIIPVDLRFFTFQISSIPLFSVIVTIFILGFFSGYSVAWIKQLFSSNKKSKSFIDRTKE
ncbi:MAG: lipopolysaccharide assembly protein LapA domain-containing protein [Brevinema sp.]